MKRALVVLLYLVSCGRSEPGVASASPPTAMPISKRTPPTDPGLPSGWSIVRTPGQRELACANQSRDEWRIAIDDAGVHITSAARREPDEGPELPFALSEDRAMRGRRHVLAVDGGFLVGTDAGEWGGALYWFNQDGTRRAQIAGANVRGLVALGAGEVLVLEGLNHMSLREGTARWVVRDHGAWRSAHTATLDAGPSTLVAAPDAVYTVTPTSLTRIKRDRTVQIVQPLDTTSLYPESMTVDATGQLWIGMRHYVVRLTPAGARYTVAWLARGPCV
ncbi:MAG TPA: hypothetical protein VFK02_16145 [Kofleriaceae bacterium]|nr:hypothetical protein [Kofleriaceae bacterium]